jgi:hypothetical protein
MSFQNGITNCDERINSLKEKIHAYQSKAVLSKLFGGLFGEEFCGLGGISVGWEKKVENLKVGMKMVEIEKMVYKAHEQQRKATLPLLFEKYSAQLAQYLELSQEEVNLEFMEQGSYLEMCRESLNQRDFIKKMCGVA